MGLSRREFLAAYRPKPFKAPPVDYGVIVWRGDNRYSRADAVKVYKSQKLAQKAADKLNAQGGQYVVRTFDRARVNRHLGRGVKRRKNPPVVIFGNPPRPLTVAKILSRDVQELWYKHSYNGHQYYHPFDKGVTLQLLSDGSLRFVRPDGKPLWEMFPADTR